MERTVGIFFFVGLLMLGLLSFWVDDEGLIFGRSDLIVYHAKFESAEGLRKGDPVFLQGYKVGKIENIEVASRRVDVRFSVTQGYRLKKDSEATIGMANLLGGSRLNLTTGSEGADVLPDGGEVRLTSVGAGLDALLGSAEEALTEIKGVVVDNREDVR